MRSNTDRKPSRLAPVLAALGTILVVFILVGTMLWAFLSAGGADTIAVGVMALYGVVGLAVVGGVLAALIQRLREIKRGEEGMPKNIDPGQRAQKKDARKGAAFFALVQLAMALLLLWGRSQLAGLEGLDWLRLLLLILAVGDLVTIPAVWIVLKQRMKEIEGGELDAARKY